MYEPATHVMLFLDSGLIRCMVIDYDEKHKTYTLLGSDNEKYVGVPKTALHPVLDTPPST